MLIMIRNLTLSVMCEWHGNKFNYYKCGNIVELLTVKQKPAYSFHTALTLEVCGSCPDMRSVTLIASHEQWHDRVAQIPWCDCAWWHTVCGIIKLMWLRSISDDFQAAQFYTCCREQMVLADNVAGGGSMAEKIQRGETRFSGAREKGEKRLRRVILIHITYMDE